MNRIEKILQHVEEKLTKYPDDKFWNDTYGKQVKFFKWLLEESEELPVYELHQRNISPSVWGMGDVTYHIDLQLDNIKTPVYPVILVFDYDESEQVRIKENKK